ncbi:MAG: TatD family hydrolase [Spirochaetes bacterium]|nr:TatD family hydrolase [Spirochaetota bacterium]
MRIVDAHCHLDRRELLDELDSVLREADDAGVVAMVTASVEPHLWTLTRDLAAGRTNVLFSIGMHPWIASPLEPRYLDILTKARDFGAAAIGEIGLDRMIDSPSLEEQVPIFETQLAVARETNMPVVIHVRRAFGELHRSLKRVGLPAAGGYIHNFTGSAELARDLSRFGLCFSMGGVLTYGRNGRRDALVRYVYPDRLLLETDAPDILPLPHRGVPNRPAYIVHALHAASEILGVPEEEVAKYTTRNACRVLGLVL